MGGFRFDKLGAFIEKDPNAKKNYEIDFASEGDSFLQDGDTLFSAVWNVPAPLVKESQALTPTKAIVWLSGGVVGSSYNVVCSIVTTNGIADDRSFRVVIKEQ